MQLIGQSDHPGKPCNHTRIAMLRVTAVYVQLLSIIYIVAADALLSAKVISVLWIKEKPSCIRYAKCYAIFQISVYIFYIKTHTNMRAKSENAHALVGLLPDTINAALHMHICRMLLFYSPVRPDHRSIAIALETSQLFCLQIRIYISNSFHGCQAINNALCCICGVHSHRNHCNPFAIWRRELHHAWTRKLICLCERFTCFLILFRFV